MNECDNEQRAIYEPRRKGTRMQNGKKKNEPPKEQMNDTNGHREKATNLLLHNKDFQKFDAPSVQRRNIKKKSARPPPFLITSFSRFLFTPFQSFVFFSSFLSSCLHLSPALVRCISLPCFSAHSFFFLSFLSSFILPARQTKTKTRSLFSRQKALRK